MNERHSIAAARLAMLLFCVISLPGCNDRGGPDAGDAAIPGNVQAEVARIGESAAASLRNGLSARLTTAMAAGGAALAIDVCALEALPLTDSIAAASSVTAMKRTSLRTRNPHNAPDTAERVALAWFEEREAAGERPASSWSETAATIAITHPFGWRRRVPVATGRGILWRRARSPHWRRATRTTPRPATAPGICAGSFG